MIDALLRDVRYALRGLRKAPGFTAVAVVTLALGIGVNSGIFSLVNAILLRPLPVHAPEELVDVYGYPTNGGGHNSSSWLDYQDYRASSTTLSGLMAFSNFFANMANEGRSELVIGEIVSDNYFDVLGVQPALGRSFAPEEFVTEQTHPVAVLGHAFWQSRFGGDRSVLGRTITLNGTPYDVIGVAPEGFGGMFPAAKAQLWIPAMMVEGVEPMGNQRSRPSATGDTRLTRRGRRWLWMRGRLAPDASVAQVQAELTGVAQRLGREYPTSNELEAVRVVATEDVRVNPDLDATIAPAGTFILAVAALVLLVACANLANMLLARASARGREIAVRLAIGSGRSRLVRQLLTESLLLAVAGGAAGVGLAVLLTRLLMAYRPPLPVNVGFDFAVDWRVVLFAFAASAVTGVAFGLVPALRASRTNLVTAIKDGGSASGRRRRIHLRDGLVIVQLAFSLVLLVTGSLLVRSLSSARDVDLGYDPDRLAFMALAMEMNGYDADRSEVFYGDARRRLSALPGVEGVTLMSRVPLSLNDNNWSLFLDGHQTSASDRPYVTAGAYVDAEYFSTMGLELVAGRSFDAADVADGRRVVVITESMAERYWPRGDGAPAASRGAAALGQRLRTSFDGEPWEIVGVVEDYRVNTPGEAPTPYLHFPYNERSLFANFVVRTDGEARLELPALERELRAIDPDLVFLDTGDMRELADVRLLPIRVGAVLIAAFGGLALAIAAVGLYGVIGYSVARRTREMGIRVALGAERERVVRLILAQGMWLVLIGGVGGALLAALLAGTLSSVLFVSAFDPVSFVGAFGALSGVALLANWVPARRAARVDPIVALKSE